MCRRSGSVAIAATVASNIYLGEIRQFTCRLGETGDLTWRVSMLAHEAPEVGEGQKVHLRFSPAHCVLVK